MKIIKYIKSQFSFVLFKINRTFNNRLISIDFLRKNLGSNQIGIEVITGGKRCIRVQYEGGRVKRIWLNEKL